MSGIEPKTRRKLRKYASHDDARRARMEQERLRTAARINIGKQLGRWNRLMLQRGLTKHAEVAQLLLDCWFQHHPDTALPPVGLFESSPVLAALPTTPAFSTFPANNLLPTGPVVFPGPAFPGVDEPHTHTPSRRRQSTSSTETADSYDVRMAPPSEEDDRAIAKREGQMSISEVDQKPPITEIPVNRDSASHSDSSVTSGDSDNESGVEEILQQSAVSLS